MQVLKDGVILFVGLALLISLAAALGLCTVVCCCQLRYIYKRRTLEAYREIAANQTRRRSPRRGVTEEEEESVAIVPLEQPPNYDSVVQP